MTHSPRLTDICLSIGLTEVPPVWRQTWPQSAGTYTAGDVFFLNESYVREHCDLVRTSEPVTQALVECAAAVREDPALERLAWHMHWLLCLSGRAASGDHWPSLPPAAHPANPMLYGLIVLSGVPCVLRTNGVRGIDREITLETLSDLQTWTQDHMDWESSYRFNSVNWMQHHIYGKLFKLGRLEYLPGTYGHPFRWYRHAASGQVVALAEDGHLFRDDGQFASADRGTAREGLWKSRLVETRESIIGSAVSPWGRVLKPEVTLETSQWHEILRLHDPVMTVHIPSKGRMTPEECGASFEQAVSFFARHFPDWIYRAFTCQSWLLDPQFEDLDPVPANIAAFGREWYLHPVEGGDDRQHWQRSFDLFGLSQPRWDSAEPKTSLQRALVEFVKHGGRPRGGGSVLFPEDLDWGRQVYRTVRKADLIS